MYLARIEIKSFYKVFKPEIWYENKYIEISYLEDGYDSCFNFALAPN
jgi:hypothetical protein